MQELFVLISPCSSRNHPQIRDTPWRQDRVLLCSSHIMRTQASSSTNEQLYPLAASLVETSFSAQFALLGLEEILQPTGRHPASS